MFNFFSNIGLGIVAAFTAFTGAFNTQPTSVIVQPQPTQILASTTLLIPVTPPRKTPLDMNLKKDDVSSKIAPTVSYDIQALKKQYGFSTQNQLKESEEINDYRNKVASYYQDQIKNFKSYLEVQIILKEATEVKISDLKDKIGSGIGFKIGNPDSASAVDYMADIFSKQIDNEKRSIENRTKLISWIEDSLKKLELNLNQIKDTTKSQLDSYMNIHDTYKIELAKNKKYSDELSRISNMNQNIVDGIIAGLSSKYTTNSNSYQNINLSIPNSFVPPVMPSNIRKCISNMNTIGEVETICY